MALTDHRIYNKKNFGDRPMTILPGVELDSNFPEMHTRGVRCHHIVCLGPLEGNGYAQDQRFRAAISSGPRIPSPCSTTRMPTAT